MFQLNLPTYQFNIKKGKDDYLIFDTQRKRFVKLTPEEWVRQHFIRFLIENRNFPAARLAVEHELTINGMKKRCDAVFFDLQGEPMMIVEFKAPQIPISQKVFDQVAVYNTKLKVDFFIVSNGLEHYCCKVNQQTQRYEFFQNIPSYAELSEF